MDYRKFNGVTRKDSYPLPRVSNALEALSRVTWLSAFKLKKRFYWQVGMHPEVREKTAFTTGRRLWQFRSSYAVWTIQCTYNLWATNEGSSNTTTTVSVSCLPWWHFGTFDDHINSELVDCIQPSARYPAIWSCQPKSDPLQKIAEVSKPYYHQ